MLHFSLSLMNRLDNKTGSTIFHSLFWFRCSGGLLFTRLFMLLFVLQVLVTVNDRDTLGHDLLSIVGQRVAHKLSKLDAQMVVELMSNVNPALSTWLKSMVSFLLTYFIFY